MFCRSLNLLFIWWTPVIPQGSVSFCPLSFYSGSSRGPQVLPCLPELSGAVSVWCLPSSPVVSQSWSGRFGHLCARGGARGRTASRHNPHQSQRSPHTGTQAHSHTAHRSLRQAGCHQVPTTPGGVAGRAVLWVFKTPNGVLISNEV